MHSFLFWDEAAGSWLVCIGLICVFVHFVYIVGCVHCVGIRRFCAVKISHPLAPVTLTVFWGEGGRGGGGE